MTARLICPPVYNSEIGEPRKAIDTVEKISVQNYYFRIVRIATTLGYEHNDAELARYVEKSLFNCWLAMDQILEVHTSRLSELGKHEEAAAFCRMHLKLLSVFDEGCDDFYVTHKLWASFTLAHSYRKMGDKERCLEALHTFARCVTQVKQVKESSNFHISIRNPLFFSHICDEDCHEESMYGFDLGNALLSAFDAFFGDDEQYLKCKKEI